MSKNYFADLGEKLIRNGYSVVPIEPGFKYPEEGLGKWQTLRLDRPRFRKMLPGREHYGLGIISHNAPLVDIDVRDESVVAHMTRFIETEVCGRLIPRVGQAPKTGFLFRSDGETAFKKLKSSVFLDPTIMAATGDRKAAMCHVEVLGDGQQFVAFHTHPDTGKPYSWPGSESPTTTARDDLPELSVEDAQRIIDEFDRHAIEDLGWEIEKETRQGSRGKRDPAASEMHRQLAQRPIEDLTDEQIEDFVMLLPRKNRYDDWLQLGQILHQQYQGGDKGLELWHKHSLKSDDYDAVEIDRKWPSFGKVRNRENLTFRTVIEEAKKYQKKRQEDDLKGVLASFAESKSIPDLEAAAKLVKRMEFDAMTSGVIVKHLQDSAKRISGTLLDKAIAKRMIRREDASYTEKPDWVEDVYFCEADNVLYNYKTGARLSPDAFNNSFNKKLLTRQDRLQGIAVPEVPAATLALNLYQVTSVHGVMYVPGEEDVFRVERKKYVNGFHPESVPAMPEKLSRQDRVMIKRFQAHLEHLIENEKDRNHVLAWFAYIAINLRRPGHGVLMRGVQKDGKSWFADLMASMIGSSNVTTINATTIESSFNDYAHGSVFAIVEEIKLHGHNRYDVINKIKPLLTNATVEIHGKGTKRFTALNTQAYFLTTNYADAIPLGDDDTRYFVVFTRFNTPEELDAFNTENPGYYDDLWEIVEGGFGPAIRKWLIEEYKMPEDFQPKQRAPKSSSRGAMIEASKSADEVNISDILEEGRTGLSDTLLSSTMLVTALLNNDAIPPQGNGLAAVLRRMGFVQLERMKYAETKHTFWSKKPRLFRPDNATSPQGVRDAIRIYMDDDF